MGQSVLSVSNLIDNDENKISKENLEEMEDKKEKESIIWKKKFFLSMDLPHVFEKNYHYLSFFHVIQNLI